MILITERWNEIYVYFEKNPMNRFWPNIAI